MSSRSKIKKHFSLFMVKKTIKKSGHQVANYHTSTIIINENQTSKKEEIPRFLDPITYYHIFADIVLVVKHSNTDSEPPLNSLFSRYKRISNIFYDEHNHNISLKLENMTDTHDSWKLLAERLNTLSDTNAHQLSETLHFVFSSSASFIKFNDDQPKSHKILGPFLDPENEKHIVFQHKIKDILKDLDQNQAVWILYKFKNIKAGLGPQLIEIMYSESLAELFCGDINEFIHYVIDNGILDVYTVEQVDYFHFLGKFILIYSTLMYEQSISFQLRTKEGYKIPKESTPLIKVFHDDINSELVGIFYFDNDINNFEFLKKIRGTKKKNMKNNLNNRDKQLENILEVYYRSKKKNDNTEEKSSELEIQNYIQPCHEYSLLRNKECGFKEIN